MGSRESLLVQRQTRSRRIASSSPGRSGGRIFFSRVNFVCWFLFGVRSTPVLPQWHVKDPGHSAKSAGGRLHLNTHTPMTQRSRSGLTMLFRHRVGTYPETSSHATRQGTLGHSDRNSHKNRIRSGQTRSVMTISKTATSPPREGEPAGTSPGVRHLFIHWTTITVYPVTTGTVCTRLLGCNSCSTTTTRKTRRHFETTG